MGNALVHSGDAAQPGSKPRPGWARRRLLRAAAWLALAPAGWAFAAEPLVIGQSLPLGSADDGSAARASAGARAYIEFVNASGGIRGRQLKLLTLDDGGDPRRHVDNLRQLVTQHKAVALLNCVGDAACAAGAQVARTEKVALIGPMSGAAALGRDANPYVFRTRATYAMEAEALTKQMLALGTSKVVIVTDRLPVSEGAAALQEAFARQRIASTVLDVDPSASASVARFRSEATSGRYHAMFVDMGVEGFARVSRLSQEASGRWPLFVTTCGAGNVSSLLTGFSGRVVGFTSVVPNPEVASIQLTRDLQEHAERFAGGGQAVTFAGMEGYINARICVDALRRASAAGMVDARGVLAAMNTMGSVDLGGFTANFSASPSAASDRVDVVVRARSGHLLK